MSTKTSLVARQYRLQEWATQIQDCKNRPSDMTVAQWCDQHDITTANYYYRQGEVRKALLSSVGQPSEEQSGQSIPFVDISDAAASRMHHMIKKRPVRLRSFTAVPFGLSFLILRIRGLSALFWRL